MILLWRESNIMISLWTLCKVSPGMFFFRRGSTEHGSGRWGIIFFYSNKCMYIDCLHLNWPHSVHRPWNPFNANKTDQYKLISYKHSSVCIYKLQLSTVFVSVHLISISHICISPLSSFCPCKWVKQNVFYLTTDSHYKLSQAVLTN